MSSCRTSLAVLMTCHNRREMTLRCLRSLAAQTGLQDVESVIFLVDDGSTDATAAAVAREFPQVRIIPADGSLYWTGGMRSAMAAAMETGFDYYLWLNDDTQLDPDALTRLLATYRNLSPRGAKEPIVVGSLRFPGTEECSYGGAVRASRWHPLRFERIHPRSTPVLCDVFNGNVVLIGRSVVAAVGNLHPRLRHTGGDYEYALRAARSGVALWVASGFCGECPRNSVEGTWLDPDLSLIERYRRLLGPKGHPIGSRTAYMATYGGFLWPALFLSVYIMLPFRHMTARLAKR